MYGKTRNLKLFDINLQAQIMQFDELHDEARRYALIRKISKDRVYYIRRQTAELLCARVRHSVGRNLFKRQWWRCFGCVRKRVDGIPAGLVPVQKDFYRCRSMAKLHGYAVEED